jgi:photosystem II stability/assembly factor-like uncharacterized protein
MRRRWVCALALASLATASVVHAAPVGPALERPALQSRLAARSVLQGAARVGDGAAARLVAVGERGIVLSSEDGGKSWRQLSVPVSVGLTAVAFADAQHGWITGHGGLVLATVDGGQTWVKQLDGIRAAQILLKSLQDMPGGADPRALADAERLVAEGADKPFLDLHVFDSHRVLVVGAYNLAFETNDGGKTWQPLSGRLDNPKGLHLYTVDARGEEVVIAGEQGLVLRSTDRGRSFVRMTGLPYKGSLFTVALPGDGEILVAGLRGNAWKSTDGGIQWTSIQSPVTASFTASAVDARGQLWLANQAGMVLRRSTSPRGDVLVPMATSLPPLNGLLLLDGSQALGLSVLGAVPVSLNAAGAPK